MKTILRGFYHKSVGTVKRGAEATKDHEEILKKCKMDVSRYIGGKADKVEKKEKPTKKSDE